MPGSYINNDEFFISLQSSYANVYKNKHYQRVSKHPVEYFGCKNIGEFTGYLNSIGYNIKIPDEDINSSNALFELFITTLTINQAYIQSSNLQKKQHYKLESYNFPDSFYATVIYIKEKFFEIVQHPGFHHFNKANKIFESSVLPKPNDYQQDSFSYMPTNIAPNQAISFMQQLLINANQLILPKKGGSCAALVHLSIDNILSAVNVGDARVVLYAEEKDKLVPIQLTVDQKSESGFEKKRIIIQGGKVTRHRVNGILDPARALGDTKIGQVSKEPDFLTINLKEYKPKYLLIASDGVFDKQNNEQCGEAIEKKFNNSKYKLLENVINSRSSDNLTYIIIDFKKPREQNYFFGIYDGHGKNVDLTKSKASQIVKESIERGIRKPDRVFTKRKKRIEAQDKFEVAQSLENLISKVEEKAWQQKIEEERKSEAEFDSNANKIQPRHKRSCYQLLSEKTGCQIM